MKKKRRIILVEDHPLMRNGIRSIVSDSADFEIIGEAGSLKEAREVFKKIAPDMVLLDVSLPDGIGFDLIPEIMSAHPGARIVLLTMHKESPYLVKAIQDGAWGYVVKDMAPERLIDTLRRVRAGEKCFFASETPAAPGALAEAPAAGFLLNKPASPDEPEAPLSQREEFVMKALARGEHLTDIANELKISVKTVFTYRLRILQKLKLRSNSDIVRYTMTKGIKLD